jgi:hypothetical protein
MKAAAIALLVMLSGCAAHLPHREPAQSWDQENLKRSDHGCPTAIFIAPNGALTQC